MTLTCQHCKEPICKTCPADSDALCYPCSALAEFSHLFEDPDQPDNHTPEGPFHRTLEGPFHRERRPAEVVCVEIGEPLGS